MSKQVFQTAFELLVGRPPLHPVETGGRTDPVILVALLRQHDLQPPADNETLHQALRKGLDQQLNRLRQLGYALPGAAEALAALTRISGVVQSVLTGNIRPNAIAKLAAFGLDRYIDFDVGAFGSDHTERSRLVRIAQLRAGAKYNRRYDHRNTVVIGDTPRDVQAGLDGGARTVGVATGANSKAELVAAGAEAVLSDLTKAAWVVDAVLGKGAIQ